MAFRPCIDLRHGAVVQIVGGTLSDDDSQTRVNFVSQQPPEWYAELYRRDHLRGGHVIMLGPGNEAAALSCLAAYPGGLQLGGGITPENAGTYLDAGASHVIVTSYLFDGAVFSWDKLDLMSQRVGRDKLVVDVSCRRRDDGSYRVATNRWATVTEAVLSQEFFDGLSAHCAEILVHAADVEGQCRGIDEELVTLLGQWCPIPATYAGGARALSDIAGVEALTGGRVDLTIGSALDIFGGTGVRYSDAAALGRTF